MDQQESPAKKLEEFLGWVEECRDRYTAACEAVSHEERRLQDLLHEMEFAPNRNERNRAATKLQQSRRLRRKNKDILQRNEEVVKFFEEQGQKGLLKRMRQLLGKQRTVESYLDGKRVYKPRVEQEVKNGGQILDGKKDY